MTMENITLTIEVGMTMENITFTIGVGMTMENWKTLH